MSTSQELNDTDLYFGLFEGELHIPDWPLFRCAETIRLVKEKAASYGLPHASVSMFIRAFGELKRDRIIAPVRATDPLRVASEETFTVEDYRKMPYAEVIRKWREDTDGSTGFRSQVQSLIDRGLI